jgi:hypothetical protein
MSLIFGVIDVFHRFLPENERLGMLWSIVNLCFVICLFSVSLRTFFAISAIMKPRFAGYGISGIAVIGGSVLINNWLRLSGEFKGTAVAFTAKLFMENGFVLLMALFHWPVNIETDNRYAEPSAGSTDLLSDSEESD